MAGPARPSALGLEVAVRVTPRAARAEVDGVVRDAAGAAWLAVRVTPAAEGGKATAAAADLLAVRFGVARSSVRLLAGAGSRRKRFLIVGDAAALAARLPAIAPDEAP